MHILFIAVAFFLTVAASAPAPALSQLPQVQLRLTGPDASRYTPSTQNPSKKGHIIKMTIGTALSSFEQTPLLLQGIEIVDVEGDAEVFCKAKFNHSSKGRVISSREQGKPWLDQATGGVVKVTGLSCGFGPGSV
jgi:hypothetical protein